MLKIKEKLWLSALNSNFGALTSSGVIVLLPLAWLIASKEPVPSFMFVLSAIFFVIIFSTIAYWFKKINTIENELLQNDNPNIFISFGGCFVLEESIVGEDTWGMEYLKVNNIQKVGLSKCVFDEIKFSDPMPYKLAIHSGNKTVEVSSRDLGGIQKIVDYIATKNVNVELLNVRRKKYCTFNDLKKYFEEKN